MAKTFLWIEDRKGKASYTFWENFMKQLCPDVIVESKKNNSELVKAVSILQDATNRYIIVFDNSFDNLLPHRTNTDELQTILDDRENQHTADNTADGANTAVQRYTADYTGCDGIRLIAVAIVVGCASCPGGFQHAANPVHEGSEDKDQHNSLKYIDTGYYGRFPVAADRINRLSKGDLYKINQMAILKKIAIGIRMENLTNNFV